MSNKCGMESRVERLEEGYAKLAEGQHELATTMKVAAVQVRMGLYAVAGVIGVWVFGLKDFATMLLGGG